MKTKEVIVNFSPIIHKVYILMKAKPVSFCLLIFKFLLVLLILNSKEFPQDNVKPNLDSLFQVYVTSRQVNSTVESRTGINRNLAIQHEKCGFGLSALVHYYLNDFSPIQKAVISKITERPVLSNSIVSPSGHFRIHYDSSGPNKPQYDPALSVEENVRQVALAFDSSYSYEVDFMGFPAPPEDGSFGGDKLYDIYIVDQPVYGRYGGTEPEIFLGENKWISNITVDNDFAESWYSTQSFDALRVTAAHEFNHAIQIGCYALKNDIFFNELTSTAMEDFVFGNVNDYCKGNYIKDYFSNPGTNYFTSVNDGFNENGYRIGIWNIFLKERYGNEIIRRQWELYTEYPALRAINLSLLEHNSSFLNEFDQFGIWTYFTGYRAISNKYFKDALYYPVINYLRKFEFSQNLFPLRLSTDPVSNTFLGILVKTGSRTDTIVVKITNGDINRGLSSPFSGLDVYYDLFNGEKENYRKVVNNFVSKLSSADNNVLLETDFYNNNIADAGIINYSELEFAYPNPYSYNEFYSVSVTLPVAYNDLRQARIRIYSISGNLIFSGEGEIFDNKVTRNYSTKWNGLNSEGNKLPTGVYIYVTSSMGEIRKGKIVIMNN